MKKLLLGIILLTLMTSLGYCQEEQPLTLTISSDKQVYEVGEEIFITINIVNTSNDVVEIYKHERLWLQTGSIKIQGPNGACRYKGSYKMVSEGFWDEFLVKMQPGEAVNLPIGLYVKDKHGDYYLPYDFSIPGKYIIHCKHGKSISNTITIEVVGRKTLPHSMKGYELYSWQVGDNWYFTLITGTNRIKTYEEITSDENIESDWVKITVKGVNSIKEILSRLPKNEWVSWSNSRLPQFTLPNEEMVEDIKNYCEKAGLKLLLSTSPIPK